VPTERSIQSSTVTVDTPTTRWCRSHTCQGRRVSHTLAFVYSSTRADYSPSPLVDYHDSRFRRLASSPKRHQADQLCPIANLRCCPFVAYKPHLAWRHQIHPCLKLCPGRSTSSYHPSLAHRSGYRLYPIRRLAHQWRLGEVVEQRHQCGSG
jgi:hypothetical protein